MTFTDDPTKLREGLKPNSISIGYSGPKKRWGWKRDVAGAETNLGDGFTGSYSYSLDTPELVDKAIENLANRHDSQGEHAHQHGEPAAGLKPTLLNEELGKFAQVFYDTPIPYTVSREKAAVSRCRSVRGEALGLKLGFGVDFKSESKVGWTREGHPLPRPQHPARVMRRYRPRAGGCGLYDTVRQTWKALLASFATDFSDVRKTIVRGAEQLVKLQSQFTATMMIDSTRLPDGTDVRLLSWRYTPVTVPTKDYRYMPADSAGAGDAPHYGIGGFHQFAPTAWTWAARPRSSSTTRIRTSPVSTNPRSPSTRGTPKRAATGSRRRDRRHRRQHRDDDGHEVPALHHRRGDAGARGDARRERRRPDRRSGVGQTAVHGDGVRVRAEQRRLVPNGTIHGAQRGG